MANVDSISFALLIPFAICFALIFLVCCFADEIKEICRLPSPMPRNYIEIEHRRSRSRRRRRSSSNGRRHQRPGGEDSQALMNSEEGRNRNISESSVESDFNMSSSRDQLIRSQAPILTQNGLLVCPQTSFQTLQVVNPSSTQVVLIPATHSVLRGDGRTELHVVDEQTILNNATNSASSDFSGTLNRNRTFPNNLNHQLFLQSSRSTHSLRNLPQIIPQGFGLKSDK